MKSYTYLIGPMEDVTEEHMKGWRSKATQILNEKGIETLDPTRRVSFHDQLGDRLEDTQRNMNLCRRIFKMDMQDLANSTVVLADVRRCSGKGTGSAMEIMFAHMKNKIIILWCNEDDFPHPFFEAVATEKHFNLEEALDAVKSYY